MKPLKILFVLQAFFLAFSVHAQEMETVIQKGHLGAVKTAAFSPDGNFLVTGGRDRTAILWEIKTGREMRTFIGHEGTIVALKFSPDGKFIATGSTDKTAKLWDVATGDLIRTFPMKGSVTGIAFSADGKYIVLGGYQLKTGIFETASGKLVRDFEVSPNMGTGSGISIDISPDNKKILIGEDNRKAVLIDFKTGKKKETLNLVEKGSCGGCGTYAKFFSNENLVVLGSRNGPLALWNLKKRRKTKTYIEKQEAMISVDVNKAGNIILVCNEKHITLFNKVTGKKIKTIKAGKKEFTFACFSPDGKYYITTGDDGTAVLRNSSNSRKVRTFVGFVNTSSQGTNLDQEDYWQYYAKTYFDRKTNVKLSPNGKLMIIGKKDSIAKVLDFETGKTAFNLKGHQAAVICYDFSPDGKMIATGSSDKTIKLWDAATGNLLKTIKGHYNMIFSVHFNSDGTQLLSSSWDSDGYIWDVASGKALKYFKDIKAFASDYSPFGNYIVSAGLDKNFALWEIDSKEMFRKFVGHSDVTSSFDFSEDGTLLVSGSWDGTACVWDVLSGFQLQKLQPKQGGIHSVCFSNYGKYIFTGGSDGTIKMWEAKNGKLLKTFKGHDSPVTSLQISPDNQSLVSCSMQGVVKVWEIINAKIIYTYYQLTRNDWFVKARGGFFDGNAGAKKYIYFVKGMKTYHVDQFFEDFYRPGLLQYAYQTKGLINQKINLDDYLESAPPPSLKFSGIMKDTILNTDFIELDFQVIDNGGGINEIKVLQNGKRIIHDYKSTKRVRRGKRSNEHIQFLLVPGKNTIQISAFSNGRIESNTIEHTVYYKTDESLPDCYILTVGIDKYKNESLNLNYAKTDAKAFSNLIKRRSKPLFKKMSFYNLYDKNAHKDNILNAVKEIADNAKPKDVFIFYYAGHGSMLDDNFYFIPTDCIRLYDKEALETNAILAEYMQDKFNQIKALKQIMILDACQSGAATEVLGHRGAGREKAIAQLSRSSGIHVLASAGSKQYAVEFKSLGHGLFTYVLLNAMKGNADGSPLDGKITVYELKSYLDDQVPEYSMKFKGIRQYPQSYSGGNDFPIVIE